MRLNLILDRFALISGLEPEAVSRWTPLCIDAKAEIERRCKSNKKADEETEIRLSNCAAALAFYKYSLYAPEAQVENFTAGNLSVKLSAKEKDRARELWVSEEKGAEDILDTEQDFSFLGVVV